MHLRKLNYFEHAKEPNAWSLEGLILDNINLVVGKKCNWKNQYNHKNSLALDYENLYFNVRNRNNSLNELLVCLEETLS